MSAQPHERRRFQRIPFMAEAELCQGTQRWTVPLHDLSLKGLLVGRPEGWSTPGAPPCRPACGWPMMSKSA